MKSLIALSQMLLNDIGERCGVCTLRDWKTVSDRVEHEGISFLTISLPAFAKDLERSLDEGRVDDASFAGFKRVRGLPQFLGGFLRQVFDCDTGILRTSPSIDAILSLRQFLMAFGKIELPCSDEREAAAMAAYVRCDSDVELHNSLVSPLDREAFRRVAKIMFWEVFSAIDVRVDSNELLPRHGPGNTAEKLLGNEKWTLNEWTQRLDAIFPMAEYLVPNYWHFDTLQDVDVREPGAERPVRVVSVPKTLKTPRIIAIEPTCMQYMQQALMREFVDGLEGSSLVGPLIGFTDQVPNQELARSGSLNGELATLDLSEASDRVSLQHALDLLDGHPSLREGVLACRSTHADVPGFGVVPLAKFASMGSALCFPIEAMVFLTIIVLAVSEELSVPVTSTLIRGMAGRVRVYGDDIIVPAHFAPAVARRLEDFGLKVNVRKSFWTGKFRESCGGDFYDGTNVTPVRVRRVLPSTRQHASELVSAVSLRNQLHSRGFEHSVAYLDKLISRILPVYPFVGPDSPGLGRHTYNPLQAERMCTRLHRPLVKAYVASSSPPASELMDHGALMKFFLGRGHEPLPTNAFTHAGRPSSVRIKMRWIPV
ncbi:RNA-directed RNA polymerase [ssRNA phage Zoerhiza.2_25]|uniref:RNA-directed RNA polymerase n=2 Tax=Leviviricetes TaxID=2842243 RepID=A0A8S5KYB3_9VIRU|nr:RNA-directed RNA polymerase [ssRNA phage Zoerhiza.2_25]QDH86477.1 MAG: RNA-dependent RNA polymerase [Leviviridae sp.]DAD50409.1 TPA_asm: RNA-directed RNA polymerase [ssRNA phage Zoerhiza.2_25]